MHRRFARKLSLLSTLGVSRCPVSHLDLYRPLSCPIYRLAAATSQNRCDRPSETLVTIRDDGPVSPSSKSLIYLSSGGPPPGTILSHSA